MKKNVPKTFNSRHVSDGRYFIVINDGKNKYIQGYVCLWQISYDDLRQPPLRHSFVPSYRESMNNSTFHREISLTEDFNDLFKIKT